MKIVIQRVSEASVAVDGQLIASIGAGMMILVGVADDDTPADVAYCTRKAAALRIFPDDAGVMNRPVTDCSGEVLAISQFTLLASTRKGNRPSYIHAARPELAIPLYDLFCRELSAAISRDVKKGIFGADMKVSLINDGPVTIIIDSKEQ